MFKKLLRYIKKFFCFIFSYNSPKNAEFISNEDLCELIIKERKSFIRFGDGEFYILGGADIGYQTCSTGLVNILDNIIIEYAKKESNFIVGMSH